MLRWRWASPRIWRNPGKLRPAYDFGVFHQMGAKPGKRLVRPAVTGKQGRALMPLEASTVIDDESWEIGDKHVAYDDWADTCLRVRAPIRR